jgi:hypothetical protein
VVVVVLVLVVLVVLVVLLLLFPLLLLRCGYSRGDAFTAAGCARARLAHPRQVSWGMN